MRRPPVILVALALALSAGILAACGGDGGEVVAEPPAAPAEPQHPPARGDPAAGRDVWDGAGCGGCHTLADAGASGSLGPNLDDLEPSLDAVVKQVTQGGRGMPSFEGTLTEQQIVDVAAYVSGVAGK